MHESLPLKGKTAIITGVAGLRSIGFGIAQVLGNAGANLVLSDLQAAGVRKRAEELRHVGVEAVAVPADVTHRPDVDHLVQSAVQHYGGLDIVVSNAGLFGKQSLLEMTESLVQRFLATNILGNFNVCQASARQMVAQKKGGRIVIISSVHATLPFLQCSVYGATKRALYTFAQSLAIELAQHKITVNNVGPGYVPTGIDGIPVENITSELIAQRLRSIPLGAVNRPADIGRAVLYFAGPGGERVTGAYLQVDGGQGLSKF